MAEVTWECPECGAKNIDDPEATACPLCVECGEDFFWEDVKVICWHCGDPIDPDNGPLCQPCYEEDQRWQYADIWYDRMRGT